MSTKTRYTLYTTPTLSCPQRVHLTIAELNIEEHFTFIEVNLHNKPSSLLGLNPSGAVPVLIEHEDLREGADFVLTESRAICRYLAHNHAYKARYTMQDQEADAENGCRLLVADESWQRRDLARFEEAASVEVTGWDPTANKLVFELKFKAEFGLGEKDEVLIRKLWVELEKVLDILERNRNRGGQRWMAGEKFSLVDTFYMPYMHRLMEIDQARILENRPSLMRWWTDVCRRESYRNVFL